MLRRHRESELPRPTYLREDTSEMNTSTPGLSSSDWGDDGHPWLFVVNGREYIDPTPIMDQFVAGYVSTGTYPLLVTRRFTAPGPHDEDLVTFAWRSQPCDIRPSHKVETVFGAGSAAPGSVRA